ncbi:MAG: bifunctional [glutamine synthetase] adenylyltransferase/[glutamine synthetase]-adenylyl-L-tyrosine phosphorylase [Actinomycetota bacterium]
MADRGVTNAELPAVPNTRVARRLARLGFADAEQAAHLLSAEPLCWWDVAANAPVDDAAAGIVAALGRSADPDCAVRSLARLVQAAGPQLRLAVEQDTTLRTRLVAVLGASIALGQHLAECPADWQVLVGEHDLATAPTRLATAVGGASDPVVALRRAYRRELVAIAGRDLPEELELPAVMAALADLAGYVLRAALDVATAGLPPGSASCRLAIIALGKAGGRELNYVSDVDVVFVAEPADGSVDEPAALQTAIRLAAETVRICGAAAWEVDAGLRPEGRAGPLVRTLASYQAYYERWASTWEFQALLKARPVAGDAELGQRYLDVIAPMVWTAAERPGFVSDVQAMRRRVVEHLPPDIADREIKLGPGGLRDVEFAVQLLQLVHGRGDESLRRADTLSALDALRDGGYVGVDDAVSFSDAYRFLRAAEHRLQLLRLRRTHLVPDDEGALLTLARAMGFRPDPRGDARTVWRAEWALHSREVRRLHEKLFYRPLLDAVARVPSEALRLTPSEAKRRLAALGFSDPRGALHHIDALTAGLTRRAALQRALLPVMLSYFADASDPDAGLRAYRQVSDALGATPWYLRLLRDEGAVASRLAQVLGTSRYVADLLLRAPEALQLLADDDDLRPRPSGELRAAAVDAAARELDAVRAVAAARSRRRFELLRIAFADLLGRLDVTEVADAVSATTDATLAAALYVAGRSVAAELGVEALPIRLAVIAMGRLGGSEAGYGSDADVLFVFESRDAATAEAEAARIAHDVAERLRTLLAMPSADPPLRVDADLRPEGRNGPLVRSAQSYASYYAKWSSVWEAQALLRGRFAVGDEQLGRRFMAMIDVIRYPAAGVAAPDLAEIRRLKGRIDSERLPRGADPSTHLKLGRGGLADVEWTVQLLQLMHAREHSGLRTPRTLDALHAAALARLISPSNADALEASWRLASGARNAIMLVRARADDQLPSQGKVLVAAARVLGYPPGADPGQLVDDYRRAARRARRVVEQIFYGAAE